MKPTIKPASTMTKTEKLSALIALASKVAPELPGGDCLKRRAVHLASSMYRTRYGRLPTESLRDAAIAANWSEVA